ncbi:sulfatase-like hydrolase/transferase [Pelagicoccus mobilis]
MADDLGYADVGFNGCEDIPTPHIDSIADEGVVFSSGYTTYPVCGPSRAGFITGRYQQRFGFERNPQYRMDDPNMGLPLSERTIADVLAERGYRSGIIGKWHLGAHETLHPLERGFDFFYGHLGGGHRYLPEELTIKESRVAKNESESYQTWLLNGHEPQEPSGYVTDVFSDEASLFVERNKDNPFFLFLSYNAPHGPLQATEEYLARFSHIEDVKRRTYAAMVSAMDDGIGRVLDTVDRCDLAEDTLIFFLSDNGGPTTKNGSNNGLLRGNKSDVTEGGYRVPFAARWTGRMPAGTKFGNPVSSLDIMATISALSGASIDRDRPLDGVNLLPYLEDDEAGIPHDALYIRKFDQGKYTVRQGAYKLIINGKGAAPELYNLDKDIGEKQNLARVMPEKVQELEKLRLSWDEELIEPRFLGLMHTKEWIKKAERQAAKKKKK